MPCRFAPIIAAPGPEREDRLVTEELHFPASNAARATPSKSGSGVRSGAAGPSGVCSLEQKPSGNRERLNVVGEAGLEWRTLGIVVLDSLKG